MNTSFHETRHTFGHSRNPGQAGEEPRGKLAQGGYIRRWIFGCLFLFAAAGVACADTSSPLSQDAGGNLVWSISVYGTAFQWNSATEDNNGGHADTYVDPNSQFQIVVTGLLSNPFLANVTGSASSGGVVQNTDGSYNISGYLQNGVFTDTYRTSPIRGDPSSYADNGQGINYNFTYGITTFDVLLSSNQVNVLAYVDNYAGTGGYSASTFSANLGPDQLNGQISGSENGYVVGGNWDVNASGTNYSPQSGITNFPFFGTSYSFQIEYWSTVWDSNGNSRLVYTDYYSDGSSTGWATYFYDSNATNAVATSVWKGYGGSLGNWQADQYGSLTAGRNHPVNGQRHWTGNSSGQSVTYTFTSGSDSLTIGSDISSSDTYSGTDGTSFTVDYSSQNSQMLGTVSGGQTGYVISNNFCINASGWSSSVISGPSSLYIFGDNYSFVVGYYSGTYDSSANYYFYSDDSYATSGGTADYTFNSTNGSGSGIWSGNAPYSIGSWSQDSSGSYNFNSRGSPSFSVSSLLLSNIGVTVTFLQGTITDTSGNCMDTYTGMDASSNQVTVTITGSLSAFNHASTTSPYSADLEIYYAGSQTSGSYVGAGPTGSFTADGWMITPASFSRSNPVYVTNFNLYVNGSEYAFLGGIDDSSGNSVDVYSNPSLGMLTISGNSASATQSVQVSYASSNYSGTLNAQGHGEFAVSGIAVEAGVGAAAYWIGGVLYQRTPGSDTDFTDGADGAMSTSEIGGATFINGSDRISAFIGFNQIGQGGLFTIIRTDSHNVRIENLTVCPANADGSLQLSSNAQPVSFPPAVFVYGHGIWRFLGKDFEDENPAVVQAAYYGNVNGLGGLLMKVRVTDGNVTVRNYTIRASYTGTYSLQAHAFQSAPGAPNRLPMPIYGVDPQQNDILWGLQQSPRGLWSVVVANEVWRFAGTDANGADQFVGYYNGQVLTVAPPGRDGASAVTLVDPMAPTSTGNFNFNGTYFNGGFQLKGGAPAVTAGDSMGAPIQVANSIDTLKSVTGDLDLTGGLLSLGSWQDNPKMVGMTLEYTETFTLPDGSSPAPSGSTGGRVGFATGRQYGSWLWGHSVSDGAQQTLPMMLLTGPDHSLKLFSAPTSSGPPSSTPPIILNPSGRSRFDNPVRIAPQGDLDMGIFTNGPGEP